MPRRKIQVPPTKVYVLVDPRDCRVRYVGCTNKSLEDRITAHIWEARTTKSRSRKNEWMRELIACGLRPFGAVVESGYSASTYSETDWIRFLSNVGADLVNVHPENRIIRISEIRHYSQLNAEHHYVKWIPKNESAAD